MSESSKPFDGSTANVQHHDTHLAAMWSDMQQALEQYNTHNPTTQAMMSNAGVVAMQLVEKLKASGFSLLDILPKMFALFSMIQKYGTDIMAMVEEFKKIFGGPNASQ